MKKKCCGVVSCCSTERTLGGLSASDLAALDGLAVKLACLDRDFATPLRQLGLVVGKRLASEQSGKPLAFERALSALMPACGLEGVVESRLLDCNPGGARLQIAGCAEALGWSVPRVERTVCVFDAGLFEGFLRGVTSEMDLSVEETACVGQGYPSCEFVIRKGVGNDRS